MYIRIITYPERQWAAVRTHCGLINEPPQNQVSFKLNPTSQGNSVGPAWIPPTIRVSSLLALPQTSEKNKLNSKARYARAPFLTTLIAIEVWAISNFFFDYLVCAIYSSTVQSQRASKK